MAKLAYYLRVDAQDCAAELTLNGAPVLAGPAHFAWSAVPAVSEWVIAGDNELVARVVELGPNPQLRAALCQGELGTVPEPEQALELLSLELLIPEGAPPVAPLELRGTGFANHGWGRWYWQDAPTFTPDRHARQDIFDFIRQLHADLAAGSVDLLIGASRLKFADLCTCYGLTQAGIEAELRDVYGELCQLPGWRLADLDPADLELRLRCDGRVLEPVTRSGAPAIRQHTVDEPGWSLSIFMARLHPQITSQLGIIR